jgi:hypothetical protein
LKSKLALAAVSISLVVSLAANVYFYDMQQHRFASDSALQKQAADLCDQINNLQSEKANLQTQLIQTSAPKIITRLGATDVRSSPAPGHPWSGRIRLYVAGEVWNVGTAAAFNCSLHITLYQGDVVANETCVELDTIAEGSWKDVAVDIYYEGSALTNWTIIPESS